MIFTNLYTRDYSRLLDILMKWHYLQISVRSRRYAKTNTSGYRIAGIESFELTTEEMSGKAEIARVFVENSHQVIRNNVFIRV